MNKSSRYSYNNPGQDSVLVPLTEPGRIATWLQCVGVRAMEPDIFLTSISQCRFPIASIPVGFPTL